MGSCKGSISKNNLFIKKLESETEKYSSAIKLANKLKYQAQKKPKKSFRHRNSDYYAS